MFVNEEDEASAVALLDAMPQAPQAVNRLVLPCNPGRDPYGQQGYAWMKWA